MPSRVVGLFVGLAASFAAAQSVTIAVDGIGPSGDVGDVGNGVAREYGVVFELTEGVKANYEQAFGLSAYNGDDSGELPLAATYVIGRDGVIRWAFLDADYRNRAEPADVIEALQRIQPTSGG